MSEKAECTWPGRIIVERDRRSLIERAARLLMEIVGKAVRERGGANVALSGGNSPRELFELLASPAWRGTMDWGKVHVFWSDERFVPPRDAQSNFRMANEVLLSRVPIPAENVHRFMTEAGTGEEVASRYEQTIREFVGDGIPELDLVLLGLGTNAHTASLFPHSKALKERNRLVVADYVEELGAERLTFTIPLINSARAVMFLVSGGEKAEVVKDVIAGEYDPEEMPAQLVRPRGGSLMWLMDADAAQLLPAALRE